MQISRAPRDPPENHLRGPIIGVLLVEDNPGDARLIEVHLAGETLGNARFALTVVPTLAGCVETLDHASFDVVLLDLSLPDSGTRETMEWMASTSASIPVVVLTGFEDEFLGLSALTYGAQDYLVKGEITGKVLAKSIMYAVERTRIAGQLLEKEILLKQQDEQRLDALGTLAAGVAHDFNNLLAGIVGNLSLLSLDHQSEHLDNALNIAMEARDLIKQFQLLSHGDRLGMKKQVVDLHEIIEPVVSLLDHASNRIVNKRLLIQPGTCLVEAIPSELNQVFLNLGMNAIEAIEERGARQGDHLSFSACIENDTSPGRERIVHVVVEDTGPGMSEEVKRRAFEPLFTTKRSGKAKRGEGLGLAIVHRNVTRAGGAITIESTPGTGSRFHLRFPLCSP